MSYKIWWRRPGETIGRAVIFSDRKDAESHLEDVLVRYLEHVAAALNDCGYQCNMREIPDKNIL